MAPFFFSGDVKSSQITAAPDPAKTRWSGRRDRTFGSSDRYQPIKKRDSEFTRSNPRLNQPKSGTSPMVHIGNKLLETIDPLLPRLETKGWSPFISSTPNHPHRRVLARERPIPASTLHKSRDVAPFGDSRKHSFIMLLSLLSFTISREVPRLPSPAASAFPRKIRATPISLSLEGSNPNTFQEFLKTEMQRKRERRNMAGVCLLFFLHDGRFGLLVKNPLLP